VLGVGRCARELRGLEGDVRRVRGSFVERLRSSRDEVGAIAKSSLGRKGAVNAFDGDGRDARLDGSCRGGD